MKRSKSITVIGRRWFERTNGNTYYSAEIYVDGQRVHKIPFAYGYGDQYEWEAYEWLEENGRIELERYNNGGREAPWVYCERVGCQKISSVSDVSRKKDL